jgi:hypothetical protein
MVAVSVGGTAAVSSASAVRHTPAGTLALSAIIASTNAAGT